MLADYEQSLILFFIKFESKLRKINTFMVSVYFSRIFLPFLWDLQFGYAPALQGWQKVLLQVEKVHDSKESGSARMESSIAQQSPATGFLPVCCQVRVTPPVLTGDSWPG